MTKGASLEIPLVSVIIPVYNRADLVERALESVKNQAHRPLELVVVDDGSTDASVAVIHRWKEKNADEQLRVRVLRQAHLGAPSARNLGMNKARGEFLQFLDSDDTIETEKIASQLAAIHVADADVAVSDIRYRFDDARANKVLNNGGELRSRLVRGWSISTPSPLIRATAVLGYVSWNERLQREQDVDFMFKTLMVANKTIYTPGAWCNYMHHDGDRISDRYSRTAPQFFLRIRSLIEFRYRLRKTLPTERRKMINQGIVFLGCQAARYWGGKLVRRLFGDAVAGRLKAIPLGRPID
jgi:glycosyltransferase involved in cell wall biosynthesis